MLTHEPLFKFDFEAVEYEPPDLEILVCGDFDEFVMS